MRGRRQTGQFAGDANLEANGVTTAVIVSLTSWIDVLEEGVEGLAEWHGRMTGEGVAPDIIGGPHTLHLGTGVTGQLLITRLNQTGGTNWNAEIQGTGSCPF